MRSKWLITLSIVIFALGGWIFFHPSYQKSIESRYLYAIGEYDQAYLLAKESFSLDPYNRMASTIMAQSQMSLKYVHYNADAKSYKKEIHRIAGQPKITPQERTKIRMMTKIMIDAYARLGSSVVVEQELIDEAHGHYEQFKNLHDELASPR